MAQGVFQRFDILNDPGQKLPLHEEFWARGGIDGEES
jgi:hypothetical protein